MREFDLFFVRHGQSLGNVKKTFLSPVEDILTEKGIEQAEVLGKFLAKSNVALSKIYSSDYDRAIHTARILAQHQGQSQLSVNVPIIEDVRLREQNAGIYEGKSYRVIFNAILESKADPTEFVISEGETEQDVHCRIGNFMEEILAMFSNAKNPTVLAVSHTLWLRHAMNYLNNSPKFVIQNWTTECTKLMRNTGFMEIKFRFDDDTGLWNLEFKTIHGSALEVNDENQNEKVGEANNAPLMKFFEENPKAQKYSGCVHM